MKSSNVLNSHFKRSAALAVWLMLAASLATGIAVPRIPRLDSMRAVSAPVNRTDRRSEGSPETTSSLFTYRRDDSSPQKVTRIHVDVGRAAAVPIHQDLFGNFIEHLGGVVYGGLWAQALINPSLEAIEPPHGDLTAPTAWQANRQALWRPGGKELHGYHSPGYVTLLPDTGNGAGALWQIVRLPVHRVRTFVGSIAVRVLADADTSPEKEPPHAQLNLALFRAQGGDRPVAAARVEAASPEWISVPFRLNIPADAVSKGSALRLTVTHDGGASVDVDRIEIFPSDSVDGVDPDVLQRAREWHIPILRWPGGNFASGYHWRDGIGAREKRPTRRNAAWGGVESNEFGTDEFLAFCRRVGTKPQLTVNAGDGTPDEAAAWVRYCNAPLGDMYGVMRAANGHTAPYDVRLWEVGNELYGEWQIGHTVPNENAQRFVKFRDALLKADPRLRLIATGKADEFRDDGLARNAAWNDALLRAATANGGRPPDYLSIHPLVPLPGNLRGFTYGEQYESAMAHTIFLDRVLLPDLWERIQRIAGPNAPTRIAVTEWGLIVGGPRWQDGPNHDTLAGAVYNALCLNAMLRNSDHVTLANMTAFMHGGGIKKPNGVVIVDPQYYTQQLYAGARIHTPVSTEVSGPGADVSARGFLPAVRNVPDVDVFAALDGSRKKLIVCAVNRHLSEERPVTVSTGGLRVTTCAATLLTGPTAMARNTMANPNAVAPKPLSVTSIGTGGGKSWSAVIPPHSVAIFSLAGQ